VASVTGWKDKYRSDVFFHTKVNVAALQALFIAVVLVVFWTTFRSAEEIVGREVVASVIEMTSSPTDAIDLQEVAQNAHGVLRQKFFDLFSISVVLISFFGYAILRSTLSPARNSLKSQKLFISNIAHELRTPLSVIKTNIEVLLMRKEIDMETITKKLKSAVGELDRASDIINNLLSLDSYLQPNRMRFTDLDLGKVVDKTVARMKSLSTNKNIGISIKKRGDYKTVWGNATSLEQVIYNLLRNAIRYTPKGGHVVVTVEPDYIGSIVLTVQDSGIGIKEKDIFHIFEPYYRSDEGRAQTTKSRSSGLGLTIVSEVVKSHKGKIYVRSAPGLGTSVQILLPCGRECREQLDTKKNGHGSGRNEVSIDFSSK